MLIAASRNSFLRNTFFIRFRPPSLKFLSGQWIRFSCTAIQPEEFHSFTLTSAPHEDFLSVHVKAHGPYTWKLRNYFQQVKDGTIEEDQDDPSKIRIEGIFQNSVDKRQNLI